MPAFAGSFAKLRLMPRPRPSFYVAPWVRCLQCQAPIRIVDHQLPDFFEGRPISCPECQASLDWWATLLREIRENFMLNQAFAPIGARLAIFPITLNLGQRTHYKLSDYGVPADAKVLWVNYTPNAPVLPAELPSGNMSTVRPNRHEVTVWPVPWENQTVSGPVNVDVFVCWVPHSLLDASWTNLVTAFEAYGSGDYSAAIVPANVAVESALSVFLFGYLASHNIANTNIKPFLDDGATYGHQLNVLLPLVADWAHVPRLHDHIRGSLNRLRGLRNDIAHRGKPEVPLTQADTAEVLCAAFFGFRYIGFVQSRLQASP